MSQFQLLKFITITGSEHETIHSYLDSAVSWIEYLADEQRYAHAECQVQAESVKLIHIFEKEKDKYR